MTINPNPSRFGALGLLGVDALAGLGLAVCLKRLSTVLSSRAALVGISLVVASGGVFNNCIDRDLDRKMIRTRNRALAKPTGRRSAAAALARLEPIRLRLSH